jgi:hypothetical protein
MRKKICFHCLIIMFIHAYWPESPTKMKLKKKCFVTPVARVLFITPCALTFPSQETSCKPLPHRRYISPLSQNTTQKAISIAFCASVFVMISHSTSTVNRSSHPLEIYITFSHTAQFWIFPGGVYFCLGCLLSDKSWRIALTKKQWEWPSA